MLRTTALTLGLAVTGLAASPAMARAMGPGCTPEVEPVLGLAFQSRYAGSDSTRSQINEQREAEALAALKPLDSFITALTRLVEPGEDDAAREAGADCILAQMGAWARADALAELGTETAALTVGSRLAGLALIAQQVWPDASRAAPKAEVADWLSRRVQDQMVFWETATDGAAQGNLRLWAATAAAAVGDFADDPVARGWATWSATYVMCTADSGGAIPQEMSRGKRALHYQLHATAPLVTTAAVLNRQGIDLRERCDGALGRVVNFTLDEIANGGQGTMIRSGAAQTVFDGDGIESFQLAWVEPWLTLQQDARADRLVDPMRPLSYSKLGGDLTAIWGQ
ncbi:alginate lyase family protein [Jannaschia sp. 2305UL9-9]|uniref:alginate lyase family protein n=1 Tax=Jannaschia sp. 2305UL9-9 TaxID=3121638 RepID=UPI0035294725